MDEPSHDISEIGRPRHSVFRASLPVSGLDSVERRDSNQTMEVHGYTDVAAPYEELYDIRKNPIETVKFNW